MKTLRKRSFKRGFTLMELMVAMAITSIIVTVLISITSIALDTWNRSRSELRAARQAKSMVETMARDFESMVTRRGNDFEWLYASKNTELPGENLTSTNASDLVFFSAATDRYGGEIGGTEDKGGDVSCVGYRLHYRNPIDKTGNEFETFVLNRYLVNPDETFTDLLGKTELKPAFDASFSNRLDEEKNFVCENVFQFTLTFHVEVTREVSGTDKLLTVPVSVGQSTGGQMTDSFKIKGTGIEASNSIATAEELAAGRLTAVEVAITVLSDYAVDQLRSRSFSGSQEPEFMTKNSYQYSKLISLPRM